MFGQRRPFSGNLSQEVNQMISQHVTKTEIQDTAKQCKMMIQYNLREKGCSVRKPER